MIFLKTLEFLYGLQKDPLHEYSLLYQCHQEYPSHYQIPEDFVVTGRIDVSGSNAVTDLQLNAPGGKNLWSYRMAANMSNISALATSMSAQMSNQILMEIMKVRGKY